MNIGILVQTMCVLFGTIVVGYVIQKLGILNTESNRKISELIVKVTSPALIIGSVCNKNLEGGSSVFFIFFIGIGLYIYYIILAKIIIKPFSLEKSSSNIYEMMIIFTNTGFVGFPIFRVMYGDTAIFYASILHIPFNIIMYSYGVYMINSSKAGADSFKIKDVLNSGVISAILALIIYTLHIPVPKVIGDTVILIGDATIPLSMMLIGASLADVPVKDVISSYKVYIFSVVKLIILPIITYFVIRLITADEFIIGLVTVSAGLPAGTMIVMMVARYGGDTKESSVGVFLTTLFSVATIPLMVYILLA